MELLPSDALFHALSFINVIDSCPMLFVSKSFSEMMLSRCGEDYWKRRYMDANKLSVCMDNVLFSMRWIDLCRVSCVMEDSMILWRSKHRKSQIKKDLNGKFTFKSNAIIALNSSDEVAIKIHMQLMYPDKSRSRITSLFSLAVNDRSYKSLEILFKLGYKYSVRSSHITDIYNVIQDASINGTKTFEVLLTNLKDASYNDFMIGVHHTPYAIIHLLNSDKIYNRSSSNDRERFVDRCFMFDSMNGDELVLTGIVNQLKYRSELFDYLTRSSCRRYNQLLDNLLYHYGSREHGRLLEILIQACNQDRHLCDDFLLRLAKIFLIIHKDYSERMNPVILQLKDINFKTLPYNIMNYETRSKFVTILNSICKDSRYCVLDYGGYSYI